MALRWAVECVPFYRTCPLYTRGRMCSLDTEHVLSTGNMALHWAALTGKRDVIKYMLHLRPDLVDARGEAQVREQIL
jgi:hypothetical protein